MDIFTHVSLFTGYGGLDLGLKMALPNLRTVLYCDIERYSQAVIISRILDGGLDPAPIWDDIRTLDGRCWRGRVDIISGGFPCQDLSVAGKRAGIIEGNRSGLWYEYARLIGEIRPRFAFIENVTGLITNGLDKVLCDLASLGYDAEWGVVSAANAGANHRRERVWCLAFDSNGNDECAVGTGKKLKQASTACGVGYGNDTHSNGQHDFRRSESQLTDSEGGKTRTESQGICGYVSHTESIGGSGRGCFINEESCRSWWEVEPDVGRMVNGCPFRVDRLKLLGNGVIPQQARLAFETLYERITND